MEEQRKDLDPKNSNVLASIDPTSVLLGIVIMWLLNLLLGWLDKGKNRKSGKSKALGERFKPGFSRNEMKSFNRRTIHPNSPPLYAGLYNHGKTCYANTIIQSLYFVPFIRRSILSMTHFVDLEFDSSGALVSTADNMNRFVCVSIQSIFFDMQHTAWKISGKANSVLLDSDDIEIYDGISDDEIPEYSESTSRKSKRSSGMMLAKSLLQAQLATSPERFLTALGIDYGTPEDVQEAHLRIMERLVNALGKSKAAEALLQTYQGQLIKSISCTKIECNSVIDESFFDIFLEVQDIGSLEESLRRFLAQELLTGENEYQTRDHGKQEATSQYHFKVLPQILTFSLKRFRYDMVRSRRVKIGSRFTFPMELDLFPFIRNSPDFDGAEAEEFTYVLFAVFTHEQQYGGGHYYCFLKDPNEPSTHWIEMNDADVHFVDQQDVIDSNYGGIEHHSSAYRLQYVRKNQIPKLFEKEASKSTTSSKSETSAKKSTKSSPQVMWVPDSFHQQQRLLEEAAKLFESQHQEDSDSFTFENVDI